MNPNGHPQLSTHELLVVLDAQELVDAGAASWEPPWDPSNPRVWALCNHDRGSFWRNQAGRRICPVCHPQAVGA